MPSLGQVYRQSFLATDVRVFLEVLAWCIFWLKAIISHWKFDFCCWSNPVPHHGSHLVNLNGSVDFNDRLSWISTRPNALIRDGPWCCSSFVNLGWAIEFVRRVLRLKAEGDAVDVLPRSGSLFPSLQLRTCWSRVPVPETLIFSVWRVKHGGVAGKCKVNRAHASSVVETRED